MTRSCAPLALFVFNRPAHTARTLAALLANELASETDLHVFCDGPRRDPDLDGVGAVRALIRDLQGFRSVTVVERDENYGLARSIITGVSALCEQHGRVIVLEDDLVTSRWFLRFMNDGLAAYEHEPRVASIHAYMYPVDTQLPPTFFLRGADCWGWATWSRAWAHFEPDGARLLTQLERRKLGYRFDYDGNSSFMRMLRNQIRGKNSSWAIRWHASTYLADMFTLYPAHSLVSNTGFDASGTHCSDADYYATTIRDLPVQVLPVPIGENPQAREAVVRFFRAARRQWWGDLPRRIAARATRELKTWWQGATND